PARARLAAAPPRPVASWGRPGPAPPARTRAGAPPARPAPNATRPARPGAAAGADRRVRARRWRGAAASATTPPAPAARPAPTASADARSAAGPGIRSCAGLRGRRCGGWRCALGAATRLPGRQQADQQRGTQRPGVAFDRRPYRLARPLHRFEPVDLGVDPGQLVGIARPE